nr:MAG TPA: hypothetical protein [Caudoviricetes sp.]
MAKNRLRFAEIYIPCGPLIKIKSPTTFYKRWVLYYKNLNKQNYLSLARLLIA